MLRNRLQLDEGSVDGPVVETASLVAQAKAGVPVRVVEGHVEHLPVRTRGALAHDMQRDTPRQDARRRDPLQRMRQQQGRASEGVEVTDVSEVLLRSVQGLPDDTSASATTSPPDGNQP